MSAAQNRLKEKSGTFSSLLSEAFGLQEQILSHERFQDAPVLTSRTKTYKEMCEVLCQQLQVVLDSAVAPPESSIFTEVEMKNMSRVLLELFEASLKSTAQVHQYSRLLHNPHEQMHLETLVSLRPNQEHIAQGKQSIF